MGGLLLLEVQATTMPTIVPATRIRVHTGNTPPMLYNPPAQQPRNMIHVASHCPGQHVWVCEGAYIRLVMREMNTGAVAQCNTFNHLFQLWSSSLVSMTGTVSVSRKPAGLYLEITTDRA